MSRFIAIEWDDSQILLASASGTGKRITFDQAFEVDLAGTDDDSTLKNEIRAVLASHKVTKGEATVVIGRSGVEMRQFSVPNVPDDELPDIVRFQSKSYFASLNDKWQLDFVKIASRDSAKTEILAAAISPQLIEQIKEGFEDTGVVVKHIVLRPFAAAALLRDRLVGGTCQLIVDRMADETDLTVMFGQDVLLTRTVRTPATYDEAAAARVIAQEIRRTIVSASNQLEGSKVEKVIVCGRSENHGDLKTAIESDLKIAVDFFQPFEAVNVRSSLAKNLPEHAGRFAPLLGSLVDQAAGAAHTIDFLNPRKTEVSHSGRNRTILWGSIAALVLITLFATCYLILSNKQAEVTQREKQLNELRAFNSDSEEIIKETEILDKWKAGDVVWLKELDEISSRLLFADNIIVDSFGANADLFGGSNQSTVELRGKMQSIDIQEKVVKGLQDRPYFVRPNQTKDVANSTYPKSFDFTIKVESDVDQKQDDKKQINSESSDSISSEDSAEQVESTQQNAGTDVPSDGS